MRKSIFKKEISVKGSNREVKGLITVSMNSSSYTVSGTNAITHDDYKKTALLHSIEFFVDDNLWKKVNELNSEEQVMSAVRLHEPEMMQHMTKLANAPKERTFFDKMVELGFGKQV